MSFSAGGLSAGASVPECRSGCFSGCSVPERVLKFAWLSKGFADMPSEAADGRTVLGEHMPSEAAEGWTVLDKHKPSEAADGWTLLHDHMSQEKKGEDASGSESSGPPSLVGSSSEEEPTDHSKKVEAYQSRAFLQHLAFREMVNAHEARSRKFTVNWSEDASGSESSGPPPLADGSSDDEPTEHSKKVEYLREIRDMVKAREANWKFIMNSDHYYRHRMVRSRKTGFAEEVD